MTSIRDLLNFIQFNARIMCLYHNIILKVRYSKIDWVDAHDAHSITILFILACDLVLQTLPNHKLYVSIGIVTFNVACLIFSYEKI
jgi:hypothetical protein